MAKSVLNSIDIRKVSGAHKELFSDNNLSVYALSSGRFEVKCGSTRTYAHSLSEVGEKINSLDLHEYPGSGEEVVASIQENMGSQYRLEIKASKLSNEGEEVVFSAQGSKEHINDKMAGTTNLDVANMVPGRRYAMQTNMYGGQYAILVPMDSDMLELSPSFEEPQYYEEQPLSKGMNLVGIDPANQDIVRCTVDMAYPNGTFKDLNGKVWSTDAIAMYQLSIDDASMTEEDFNDPDDSFYDSEDIPSYNPTGDALDIAPNVGDLTNYDTILSASAGVLSDFMKSAKKVAYIDRSSLNKVSVSSVNDEGQATAGTVEWNVRIGSPEYKRSSLITIPLVMKEGSIDLAGHFVTSTKEQIPLTVDNLKAHLGALREDDMFRYSSKEAISCFASTIHADKDVDNLLKCVASKKTIASETQRSMIELTKDFSGNGNNKTLAFYANLSEAITEAKETYVEELELAEKEFAVPQQINISRVDDTDGNTYFAAEFKEDSGDYWYHTLYASEEYAENAYNDPYFLDDFDVKENLEDSKLIYNLEKDEFIDDVSKFSRRMTLSDKKTAEDYDDEDFDERDPNYLAESYINGNINHVRELINGDMKLFSEVQEILKEYGEDVSKFSRRMTLSDKKTADTRPEPDPEAGEYTADADDLILLIDNDRHLYKRMVEMYKNLSRKKKNGKYDASLAPKLFRYVVDEAAKMWYDQMKQWADVPGDIVNKVSKEVKEQAAKDMVDTFEQSYENKEYDFMEDKKASKKTASEEYVDYGFSIAVNYLGDGEEPDDITDEVMAVETNVLNWLKENSIMARDEGHGRDDSLLGTITVPVGSDMHQVIVDALKDDGNEPLSTGKGDLPVDPFEGIVDEIVNDFDVSVSFSRINNLPEDDTPDYSNLEKDLKSSKKTAGEEPGKRDGTGPWHMKGDNPGKGYRGQGEFTNCPLNNDEDLEEMSMYDEDSDEKLNYIDEEEFIYAKKKSSKYDNSAPKKMGSKTNVEVIHISGDADLYNKYPGQSEPQGCYIQLDCEDGYLTADYNAEIGNAVPMNVYHGHVQRWGIPCLRSDEANKLLDRLSPIAQRVVDGYDSDWDGNNMVAVFNEDAQKAIDEISSICSEYDLDSDGILEVWDAKDYWSDSLYPYNADGKSVSYSSGDISRIEIDDVGTITAKTTDDELEEMAEKMDELAKDADAHVDGVLEFLESEREYCIDEEEEEEEEDEDEED